MFEKDLQAKLRAIFGIAKTTFDAPAESVGRAENTFEQNTLFIEIMDVKPRMSAGDGGRQTAKVSGMLRVFGQQEDLTYGFFAKKVERAPADLVRRFFFGREINVLDSMARTMNLNERRLPFTYLYDSQYDPDRGTLTSLNTEISFTGE